MPLQIRKIIIRSKSDKSYGNAISDAKNKDTNEKELRKANSHIKIHISRSSILFNLFLINSTRQKSVLSSVLSIPVSIQHDPEIFL